MFAIDDAFNGIEGLPATGNEAVPLIYLKIAKEEKKNRRNRPRMRIIFTLLIRFP